MNSKSNVKDITILRPVLSAVTNNMNKARARCLNSIILALIQARSVNLTKLACVYGDERQVKIASRVKQIQRFLDSCLISDFRIYLIFNVLNILPDKVDLVMDRTNWKRKGKEINILAIGVRYQGCAIPLLFSVLDKKGNSNTKERIELMKRVIKLIGLKRIKSLTADREFIGNEWFEFLGSKKIKYYMRIKTVNKVTFKNGKTYALKTLFKCLPIKQFAINKEQVTVFGQLCNISAARVPAKGGKSELLIIASYDLSSSPFEHYKERWQIETMFKGFKTSGFNLTNRM